MFAHPAGWWALLGVPTVLLIHFLQHEARRYRTTTLFLLERLSRDSTKGRVFERLRNSAALWLQLAAVLLLTWLLVEPRWIRADSFQRVVVVLDSSVSMGAFRTEMERSLRQALIRFDRAAATTEWRLIESDPGRGTVYAGDRLETLLTSVGTWAPRLGAHDMGPAQRTARALAGDSGAVILVTDHPPTTPLSGVQWLAVGESAPNCGFAGLRVTGSAGKETWEALVRNHGAAPQTRAWSVAVGEQVAEQGRLTLAPQSTRLLRGGFPPAADRVRLVLEPDRLAIDDTLPVLRPVPRTLSLALPVDKPLQPFADRLVEALRDVRIVRRSEDPDIELISFTPGVFPGLDRHRICFARGTGASQPEGMTVVLAEDHPLCDGLVWQGLLCPPAPEVLPGTDAEVLLWQGERPLVLLRRGPQARQLVVNFELTASNADRIPAFVLLLHRFGESVRAEKRAPQAANCEVNQVLHLPLQGRPEPVALLSDLGVREEMRAVEAAGTGLRAPASPGFFEVSQGAEILYRGAARFADMREADLRGAAAYDGVDETLALVRLRNSRPDPLTPMWLLLLGAALLGSWAAVK